MRDILLLDDFLSEGFNAKLKEELRYTGEQTNRGLVAIMNLLDGEPIAEEAFLMQGLKQVGGVTNRAIVEILGRLRK
jgi:hypothetical protein